MGTHHGSYLDENKGEGFFRWLWGWLFTYDHKRIGILYMVTSLGAFLIGGIFALLIRFELFTPLLDQFSANNYNRLFTLHGAVMVFWFIIPAIPGALGNFFLPLMIGAKDVAFPRLNLASYYILLIGIGVNLYGLMAGPGADTGWTFYAPYSLKSDTAVTSMVAGVFIMGFASIFTGLNFMVTVHQLRCPGMTWMRMPLFVWAIYSTSLLQLVATPVLAITLCLLMMERFIGIGFFDPALGGDPVLFQHFFWFYSHPAVYIMILPAFGIISEVITTFSHKVIFGYKAIAYSSIGLALVSFFVWGHHMFTSGQSWWSNLLFSAMTMFTAIPTAIKIVNWTATLYGGSIQLKSPMLYCLGFLFTFAVGGLTGLFLGAISVDQHFHDTYFVVAHFHYVMVGGTVTALLCGLHHWFPKYTGRMYNEFWANVGFVFFFIGFNTTFFPQFFLGLNGMPRRYAHYIEGYTFWNQVSTVGSWMIAVGVFIAFVNFIVSARSGEKAPANPWNSRTLEWTHAASPPITHNFEHDPSVNGGPYEYGRS
jgi:cytochrome c oxidase subunit 1